MSQTTMIPDQDDVLATNERLTADNTRLTTDLAAATQRATDLAGRVGALETAGKAAGEELSRLKAENATLTARMADFNKSVAAEVVRLGFNQKAAEHKPAPADADLTPTQRVLAAKGVSSIADLSRKP